MPLTMKQLIPVMFFPWYAFFSYWQYITSALSLSMFGTLDEASEGFARSQVLTGNMNGTYNIVCFMIAFALVPIAAKLGTKLLHTIALSLGGIALICLPLYDVDPIIRISEGFSLSTLYIYPIGLGITWASMMAIPYQILAQAVPPSRTGIYMGIFNMFIVIPMIIQIFTMQTFVYDLLGKNPVNVIILAGVFLILGGISTLFVNTKTQLDDTHGL
jgi:maltose/moltooligosaccharide transporter